MIFLQLKMLGMEKLKMHFKQVQIARLKHERPRQRAVGQRRLGASGLVRSACVGPDVLDAAHLLQLRNLRRQQRLARLILITATPGRFSLRPSNMAVSRNPLTGVMVRVTAAGWYPRSSCK